MPANATRIAPTPSGYLHIGNAFNFILTKAIANFHHASLMLRIDDIDAPRIRPEYVNDIFETLDWLGINPDNGPKSLSELNEIYSQHLHVKKYEDAIKKISESGRVYVCKCSRTEVAAGKVCTCRNENISFVKGETMLKMDTSGLPEIVFIDQWNGEIRHNIKDFVLQRRDGIMAYQLVSLIEDINANINIIVRGADLIDSTAKQLWLSTLIGKNSFAEVKWYHHGLFTSGNGNKLSKSADSSALAVVRNDLEKTKRFVAIMSSLLGLEGVHSQHDLWNHVILEKMKGVKEIKIEF